MKSLTIFEDSVVQGQGQGLVNWSLKMLKDKDYRRGQQHWIAKDHNLRGGEIKR